MKRTLSMALLMMGMTVNGQRLSAKEPAADDKKPTDAAETDPQAMMKLWMKIATPGEQHKMLASVVGKWSTATKMWMGGPDGPATSSKGTAEFTSVLGGRFIMQNSKGTMLGMPYEGLGLMGFDNYKKKFTFSWTDSSGTAIYTGEGTLDKTGKVITLFGTMDEFLTGEHDKTVKYVLRIVDDNKHIFEIHDLTIVDGEKEKTKVVEITYTREPEKKQ